LSESHLAEVGRSGLKERNPLNKVKSSLLFLQSPIGLDAANALLI
jgi:hypothetical protein